MGTMLYGKGIFINRCFDELNLSAPQLVKEIHQEYVKAGAEVLETNTFGATRIRLGAFGFAEKLRAINEAGVRLAREAAGEKAFVAGAIVERAAQVPLSRFASEALEKPLGIDHVQWNVSPLGIGMGGGGTRYRSRDLAKLGQLALEEGRWKGRQVISASWIHAMLTVRAQARDDADYGYLWWAPRRAITGIDEPVWAMSGNGGNYVFVVPSRRLVAVVTSTAYNQRYAHPQSQEIFREYVLKAFVPE